MPAGWTAKRERQVKHIKKSCMKRGGSKATCTRIAFATVQKARSKAGETKRQSCFCPTGSTKRKGKCYSRKTKRRTKLVCSR